MGALELVYPEMDCVDEYLLGKDLLVAPCSLEPECHTRRIVLPEGRWVDLFDPFWASRVRVSLKVEVGADDIPVFVRAGAVLGLLPAHVKSLSPYAPAVENRRDVLAFPWGTWSGELGPGQTCRSEETGRSWSLELASTNRRASPGMSQPGCHDHRFTSQAVAPGHMTPACFEFL